MRYAYSLSLLLGAYLLYDQDANSNKVAFLYMLLLFAFLGFLVDYYANNSAFIRWLHRWL